MMLSVLRNTDKTVKFWFIENFLSPSFLVSTILKLEYVSINDRSRNLFPTLLKNIISNMN